MEEKNKPFGKLQSKEHSGVQACAIKLYRDADFFSRKSFKAQFEQPDLERAQ